MWQFSTESECDEFAVHVGGGNVGDRQDFMAPGETIPGEDPTLVARVNWSSMVRGSCQVRAPGGAGPDWVFTPLGWPEEHRMLLPGPWNYEILEANSIYVCCTAKAGHKLNYEEVIADGVYTLTAETWAVAIGGPALINGIDITEYSIAHRMSGNMAIETDALVVLLTERI